MFVNNETLQKPITESNFKIVHFGSYVLRIGFFSTTRKKRKKFYSELIRCIGTYLSIEIFSKKSKLESIISFSSLYSIPYSL